MPSPKKSSAKITIRNNKLYVGGQYSLDIQELQHVLEELRKRNKSITDCVNQYTGIAYTFINNWLRTDVIAPNVDIFQLMQLRDGIYETFLRLPPYNPPQNKLLVTYRGAKGLSYDQLIKDKGFISTSVVEHKAIEFGLDDKFNPKTSTIMRIAFLSHYNYKLIPPENFTQVPKEWEIILPASTGEFVECHQNDGDTYYTTYNGKTITVTYKDYIYVPIGCFKPQNLCQNAANKTQQTSMPPLGFLGFNALSEIEVRQSFENFIRCDISSLKSNELRLWFKPKLLKLSELTHLSHFQPQQGTGQFYTGNFQNKQYFIKNVIKNTEKDMSDFRRHRSGAYDIQLAINEVLASMIYANVYGLPVQKMYLVVNDMNTIRDAPLFMVASEFRTDMIECPPNYDINYCRNQIKQAKYAVEGFLVDCIMANWDVGETGNILLADWENNNSSVAGRVDVGGCLMYRAMGEPRDFMSMEVPNEHQTFFGPWAISKWLFSDMNPMKLQNSLNGIQSIDVTILYDAKKWLSLLLYNEQIPMRDQLLAQTVLYCVNTIEKRHRWYVSNTLNIGQNILQLSRQP